MTAAIGLLRQKKTGWTKSHKIQNKRLEILLFYEFLLDESNYLRFHAHYFLFHYVRHLKHFVSFVNGVSDLKGRI